jgi:hypothetical protein
MGDNHDRGGGGEESELDHEQKSAAQAKRFTQDNDIYELATPRIHAAILQQIQIYRKSAIRNHRCPLNATNNGKWASCRWAIRCSLHWPQWCYARTTDWPTEAIIVTTDGGHFYSCSALLFYSLMPGTYP